MRRESKVYRWKWVSDQLMLCTLLYSFYENMIVGSSPFGCLGGGTAVAALACAAKASVADEGPTVALRDEFTATAPVDPVPPPSFPLALWVLELLGWSAPLWS